jgi:hypothetical protein
MKKVLFASISICFLAISCSKSDDNPTPAADQYMTITTGSKWTYDVITNPGTAGSTTVADTVTVTATDTTVEQGTANQRIYRIFKHSNGNTSDYYNITGNDYYRFQTLPLNNLQLQNLYLKDNATVGTSWSQTLNVTVPGFPTPIPVTVTNSITEKGISKTVNGIAYNDVINIKTDISSAGLPAGTIVTDIKSYYAPKVGLIEGDYKITVALVSVDVNTQTLLKTAVIQ